MNIKIDKCANYGTIGITWSRDEPERSFGFVFFYRELRICW